MNLVVVVVADVVADVVALILTVAACTVVVVGVVGIMNVVVGPGHGVPHPLTGLHLGERHLQLALLPPTEISLPLPMFMPLALNVRDMGLPAK